MKNRVMQNTLKQRSHQIAQERQKAQARQEQAFAIKEICDANTAYVNAMFTAMSSADDMTDIVQKASLRYQNALKKYGFDEKDFELKPLCPICDDSGSHDGKPCDCIWDLYIENLKKECELDIKAPFTFDDCDLYRVGDGVQRKSLENVYDSMKKYVEKFPSSRRTTLVFSGGVGTGKTCLASAMANAVVQKGYAVKIFSAYEFNSLMLTTHTSPIAERNALLHDTLYADMLLIDDLGTEPMLKNVTVEYLLLVLEQRQSRGLATIITTNLNSDNLLNRYGERIYSRLSHKQNSLIIAMKGKDLRLQ